jgi:hypothetical protein
MATGWPAAMARRMSGISRSSAQSPPPMTLPARALASAVPCSAWRCGLKYELRQAAVTSSAQPLLLL